MSARVSINSGMWLGSTVFASLPLSGRRHRQVFYGGRFDVLRLLLNMLCLPQIDTNDAPSFFTNYPPRCDLHSKLHRNMRKRIPHSLSGAFSIVAIQFFAFQSLSPRLIRVPRPFVPGRARCLSAFLHGGCPTSMVLSPTPG